MHHNADSLDLFRSFAEDAEANCEKHLALAATLDPTDPEVYHVRSPTPHSTSNISREDTQLTFWYT
jgi:hypothetical protein